jgi:rod shape-determining protein MreC
MVYTLSGYKEYLVLAFCVLISILLIAGNNNPQIRSIRSFTILSLGFMQDVFDFVPDYFALREENRILRERNLVLSDELSRHRNAAAENSRLHRMLDLKEQSTAEYAAANVVGKNFQPFRNTLTIDAGENIGVKEDMPVVSHDGLVGRVVATSACYSVIQVLYHREMRASAKVERSRVDGILGWDGSRNLKLYNVAKTLDVVVGDQVVTSEYSSLFPPGLPIGVVAKTYEETGDLFQTVEIEPYADLYRIEEVFVLLRAPDPEKLMVEQETSR